MSISFGSHHMGDDEMEYGATWAERKEQLKSGYASLKAKASAAASSAAASASASAAAAKKKYCTPTQKTLVEKMIVAASRKDPQELSYKDIEELKRPWKWSSTCKKEEVAVFDEVEQIAVDNGGKLTIAMLHSHFDGL